MDELDIAVLELLIFPETFVSIVAESRVSASKHVIGDVLKKLLHDEYVQPLLPDEEGNYKRSLGYDSDFLNDYLYQITSKGLKALEQV